jgi:hypothetical protein
LGLGGFLVIRGLVGPQLKAKFQEIRDYWADAQRQSQISGR